MTSTQVRVQRVYDTRRADGGARVLVDRVWPRGISKKDLHLDDWNSDVAPSSGLRKWYGHDPGKFAEFRRRYHAELREPNARQALERLLDQARDGVLVLLTATKDVEHSHAAVLADLLQR
ncbi:DUF488 domain-containing protein [Kutzneria albida]|uniref:DUF488 family protein n=1 Tax=Kutzneria albida DSM 43870 TaxID=1449976 RepID=W5W8E8_9PSEU|nr:DUF488 family protein [Kutzneria albida]AHH97413.1 hypothetical protein KALB_4049 [Kutzneria albida DSM 43870]